MRNEVRNGSAEQQRSPDYFGGVPIISGKSRSTSGKELRKCKEDRCNNRVAGGKSLISQTARRLGYCRYCYQMNCSRRPDKGKRSYSPQIKIHLEDTQNPVGAEVFNPDSPWDWYETFMPESER